MKRFLEEGRTEEEMGSILHSVKEEQIRDPKCKEKRAKKNYVVRC